MIARKYSKNSKIIAHPSPFHGAPDRSAMSWRRNLLSHLSHVPLMAVREQWTDISSELWVSQFERYVTFKLGTGYVIAAPF